MKELSVCQRALNIPWQRHSQDLLAMSKRNLQYVTEIWTEKHLHNMKLSDTPLCKEC